MGLYGHKVLKETASILIKVGIHLGVHFGVELSAQNDGRQLRKLCPNLSPLKQYKNNTHTVIFFSFRKFISYYFFPLINQHFLGLRDWLSSKSFMLDFWQNIFPIIPAPLTNHKPWLYMCVCMCVRQPYAMRYHFLKLYNRSPTTNRHRALLNILGPRASNDNH